MIVCEFHSRSVLLCFDVVIFVLLGNTIDCKWITFSCFPVSLEGVMSRYWLSAVVVFFPSWLLFKDLRLILSLYFYLILISSVYPSLVPMSCWMTGKRIWLWLPQTEQRMMNWCLFILVIVCGKRGVMYVLCLVFLFILLSFSGLLLVLLSASYIHFLKKLT